MYNNKKGIKMNFEDFKNKIINDLKSKKANINISSLANFKNDNAQDFRYGLINLIEFVSKLSEKDPYVIAELHEDNYMLVDRRVKIPPQSFIGPKDQEKVLSENGKIALIQVFPELKNKIDKIFEEINDANCKGCSKNSKFFSLIQEILLLDNTNRDLQPLSGFFADKFLNALKTFQRQGIRRPEAKPIEIENKPIKIGQTIPKSITGAPRPSCIECCMKHVGTAIVLLEETNNGYPAHRWLAAGELNEASNEMMKDHPEIANEIREVRLKVTNDLEIPSVMELLNKLHNLFFSGK